MIGERKLDLLKVQEIKKLIKQNLSDKEIAEQFAVTNVCINQIRNGKRWNDNKPFLKSQKDESMLLPAFKETLKNEVNQINILYTKACEIITPIKKIYIILTLENGVYNENLNFLNEIHEFIPTFDDILKIHQLNKEKYEKI
jgi:hypothetical protein